MVNGNQIVRKNVTLRKTSLFSLFSATYGRMEWAVITNRKYEIYYPVFLCTVFCCE